MPPFPRRLSLLCTLLAVLATCAPAQSYTKVVVFGDSLSDTGNIAHLTESQFLLRYPSPLFNYTDGRFTDGKDTNPAASAYQGVWVEQLAAAFTTPPTIKNSLDGGTDYAYGDATTENGTTTVSRTFAGVPVSITLNNMGQQVSDYLATNPTPAATTLYILFGGANDLFADDSAASVTAAVQREVALVQRLVDAGATDFLIPNLPPLGGIPSHAMDPGAAALTAAAASFKAQLAAGLQALIASAQAQNKTVRIAQPDIFSEFGSAASSPMAYALANVSAAAQGISGNPDTYLIWDGLHPTTTGHHLLAAAAENLLRPLIADPLLRFSLSANTIVAGQPVTLNAQIIPPPCPTPGCPIPTGLVTFFSGTGATAVAIASATLGSTGTATATFTTATAAASPYTLTAVYAGDTTYLNASLPPQTLTVLAAAAPTATTLTSSNLNVNQGDPVTLTATVTSTAGTPTGAVTFLDGSTTLATVNLNGMGTATLLASTLSTSTLAGLLSAGPHTLTAHYAANGIFAASTSAAITETVTAPNLAFTVSPASLTIHSGTSGATTVTFTPSGGITGSITPTCGNTPAHIACTFSPASAAISGNTPLAFTLTVATNASTTLFAIPSHPDGTPAQTPAASTLQPSSKISPRPAQAPETAAFTLMPIFGIGILGLAARRRKLPQPWVRRQSLRPAEHRRKLRDLGLTLFLATAASATVLTLTGCFGGGGTSNNAAPGTYTLNIGYTLNGAANSSTQPLTVTVQ